MALHRGIQSALFYYLSCAPCTGYSYRKKRRKEADRDRAAKQALEMEQPGLYRHPSPFATNPHWQTEISLGPTPVPGKRRNPQKKGRTRTSDENVSNVASSVNLALTQGESNDSTWNLRNWQRDDAEDDYWGYNHPYRSSRRPSTNAPSTISRPLTALTATTTRSGATSYHSASNPPINELHPPIVTRMDNRADAMWMLQPPPPARVTRGNSKVNLARSDSGSSRPSSRRATNDQNLSRRVSQRIVDEKLRNGLSPSKDSLQLTNRGSESSSSSEDLRSKRRRRPPPINVSEDPNPTRPPLLTETATPGESHDGSKSQQLLVPQALSPVLSSTAASERSRSRSRSRSRNPDRDPSAHDSKVLASEEDELQDSSLKVLQELVPANSLLNVQRLHKSPSFETRIELPTADEYEEMMLLGSGKAGFDSWYESKDIATFPQWAAERVRRDVSKRWSVDF